MTRTAALPFLGLVAALAATAAGCVAKAPIPPRLAGLERTSLVEGAEAARAVARLHGRDVAPADSAIAVYGGGALTLFVSRYPAVRDASLALDTMLTRLDTGATPFTRPVPMEGHPGVRWLRGPGGAHAVWRGGAAVYWLQGDAALVERAVGEVPAS